LQGRVCGRINIAMPEVTTAQLKRVRLFARLPEETLGRLCAMAELRPSPAHSLLFHEGDLPHHIHGILEGSVVLLSHVGGGESVIEFLGSGDILLLPSVLLVDRYRVSARMTSSGLVVALPRTAFLQMAADDPALAMQCAHAVARQWSVLLEQLKAIKTHGAAERLVHFLLSQVGTTMGPASLTLPGMKKQVATRLGIKPETFSRTLRKLRAFGVEASGDVIRIRSVERLAAMLEAAEAGPA
jgi:CRP-like cAMP-binding protein